MIRSPFYKFNNMTWLRFLLSDKKKFCCFNEIINYTLGDLNSASIHTYIKYTNVHRVKTGSRKRQRKRTKKKKKKKRKEMKTVIILLKSSL